MFVTILKLLWLQVGAPIVDYCIASQNIKIIRFFKLEDPSAYVIYSFTFADLYDLVYENNLCITLIIQSAHFNDPTDSRQNHLDGNIINLVINENQL